MTDIKKEDTSSAAKTLAKQPLLKLKDGQAVLPVFSEIGEFQRFAARHTKPQTKMRLVPINATDLVRAIPKNAMGCSINPAGFNLLLPKEQLERLLKRYTPE